MMIQPLFIQAPTFRFGVVPQFLTRSTRQMLLSINAPYLT
jgi:hypothetical protein